MTNIHISSGIAAWLFALKSFGLVPLPKSSPKKNGEGKGKEKEQQKEKEEKEKEEGASEERIVLPDSVAYKKHLQFLNRFVYSKKQHQKNYGKVGEERKKSEKK